MGTSDVQPITRMSSKRARPRVTIVS